MKTEIKNNINIRDKIIDIYNEKREDLLRYISSKTSNYSITSEDILHDVFTKLLLKDDKYLSKINNLFGFILISIKNRIIDSYRRKIEDKNVMIRFCDIEEAKKDFNNYDIENALLYMVNEEGSILYHQNTPSELFDYVYKALDTVPEEQARAFILNKFQGVPFKVMAEEEGISINTILAREKYARDRIKKYITNELKDELFDFPEIN